MPSFKYFKNSKLQNWEKNFYNIKIKIKYFFYKDNIK